MQSTTMDSCEYQLTIKSANQKVDDYVIKCQSAWTVQRLKQHISETHICKPLVGDQRLIYAGNLLKDSQILQQIFFRDSLCTELTVTTKTDFTIHLVCSTPKYTANDSSRQNRTSSGSSSQTTPTQSCPQRSRPVEQEATSESSNQTTATQETNHVAGTSSPPSPNLVTTQPTRIPSINTPLMPSRADLINNLLQSDHMRQQMAIFQQLAYVVAAQIAHSLSNNNVNLGDITASGSTFIGREAPNSANQMNTRPSNLHVSSSSISTNHINVPQMLYAGARPQTQFVTSANPASRAGVNQNENINNENNPVVGVGEPIAPQFNFAGQMQARPHVPDQPAPAPMQPDHHVEINENDVLDFVYYSIRAFCLVLFLYVNASIFRLLFLVGLLAIAFFFNRRTGRRNQTPGNRPLIDGRHQPPAREQARNQGAELEPEARGENAQDSPPNPETPARLPFLKLCVVIFTDFLASLVPE